MSFARSNDLQVRIMRAILLEVYKDQEADPMIQTVLKGHTPRCCGLDPT